MQSMERTCFQNRKQHHGLRKEVLQMKVLMKIGSLTLAVAMCAAMSVPAFAAESKKAEREEARVAWSTCKETVESNHSTLAALKGENQKRMTQIVVLQNQLKQGGTLTETDRTELSALSAAIQQQRLSLGDVREEVKALKESGRASMKGGDKQEAVAAFEAAAALQEEQIAVQETLCELLGQKLDYLNGCASGSTVTAPDVPEAPTETSDETVSETPAEVAPETPVEVPAELPVEPEFVLDAEIEENVAEIFDELLDSGDDEVSDAEFDALLEQAAQI